MYFIYFFFFKKKKKICIYITKYYIKRKIKKSIFQLLNFVIKVLKELNTT